MSFLKKILGADGAKPEELATIGACATALEALRSERETAKGVMTSAAEKRRAALLNDASDKEIAAIDSDYDRAALTVERCDLLEPRLLARLERLQSEERRALLAQLRSIYLRREADLDAAVSAALEAFGDFQLAVTQLRQAGFEIESAAFVTLPPVINGEALVLSAAAHEHWRIERERNADVAAMSITPPARKPLKGKAA